MAGMKYPNKIAAIRATTTLTQEAAAEAMGMSIGGYRKLEYGERRLKLEQIQKAATVFSTTPAAIVSDGSETETNVIPIMGYIGAGAEVMPEFEQVPPEGLDDVELRFAVPDGIIGFGVKGDSMLPRFREGDVVLVYKDQRLETRSYLGDEVAVRTGDGRRFLKTLLRGHEPGTFNLDSYNARMIESVRIVWIGEIYLIVPSKQIRQINRAQKTAASRRGSMRRADGDGMDELPLKVGS